MMIDVIIDSLLDTIKLIPYLLITFFLLEIIEHRFYGKNVKVLTIHKKEGPIFGALLGGFPQCGFSVVASNLFTSRVITIGTLVAVYLSTSDEMLPLMIGEKVSFLMIATIIIFKIIIGLIVGVIVDLLLSKKVNKVEIQEICHDDNCHCDEENIFYSSVKHTMKISLFILIANIVIGYIIYFVGEESITNLLLNKKVLSYFIASLVGLIPNCASSVIITKLYLSKLITVGVMMSGLLTGCGLGLLVLFKQNKNTKENITILSIVYFVGVLIGLLVDIFVK